MDFVEDAWEVAKIFAERTQEARKGIRFRNSGDSSALTEGLCNPVP